MYKEVVTDKKYDSGIQRIIKVACRSRDSVIFWGKVRGQYSRVKDHAQVKMI